MPISFNPDGLTPYNPYLPAGANGVALTQQVLAIFAKSATGNVRLYLPSASFQDSSGKIPPANNAGMQLMREIFVGGTSNATQSTSPPVYVAAGIAPSLTFNAVPYSIINPFNVVGDDVAVIAGVTPSGTAPTLSAAKSIVALSATNTTNKYGRLAGIMFSQAGVTAEWYGDTGGDFQATWAYPVGTYTTPRVCTSRKVGNLGSLRINGVQNATVDLTSFTTSFTPTAGWIGAQFANDTSAFTGSLYGVIAVKGGISDADLLVLEQFMNSLTPTGVSF